MEKNLKKITLWVCIATLLLWFVCMTTMTLLVRNLYAQQLKESMERNTDRLIHGSWLEEYYDGTRVFGLPGEADQRMFEVMSFVESLGVGLSMFGDQGGIRVEPDTAVVFCDPEGKVIHYDCDTLYFQYYTEESWKSGEVNIDGWGWMTLEDSGYLNGSGWVSELARKLLIQALLNEFWPEHGVVELMKLHGNWKGTEFAATDFDYVVDVEAGDWQASDAAGNMPWARGSTADEGEETIYLTWPKRILPESELDGEFLGLLQDNIYEVGQPDAVEKIAGAIRLFNEDSLNKIVVCDAVGFPGSEYDVVTEDAKVIMLTMSQARPLSAAVRSLIPVYIGSFCLLAGVLLVLTRVIRRKILQPLADNLQWQQSEVTRLSKALDYAHKAEENRRALVSGVAHELKTPLAVIHGYAEGLKERIAEDKRDKYLDIVLSETERMDGLVLQMLDLSRLEAGKVKLARDSFDLCELVREVFGKLELLAIQKNLELSFEMPESLAVRADRSRMEQVITNFASNALRYTQPGGWIKVRVIDGEEGWGMTVENKSRPFSPEQLERVFDSFYRIDESRTGKGTGLGLAIARSVVELHGGKCHVRNTGPGVEFGFSVSVK